MSESISTTRLQRLGQGRAILGEPDIISIRQTRSSPGSFFQKEKKQEDVQENFINGLIFPTTAHFSSFISSRYKGKDPARVSVKAKLFMFDAFGDRDVQIEISIPGSMEIRVWGLNGQSLEFSQQDYERAYYSSFLRSLYPMNYPQIVLYPLLNRIEILRQIMKNFVVFSLKNELRDLGYELAYSHNNSCRNLGIEIAVKYCLDNRFDELLKVILQQVKRLSPSTYADLQMQFKFLQRRYGQIICRTAQKLLLHGQANKIKQYQIRALYEVGKYSEVVFIGRTLIQSGGTSYSIYKLILNSLMEIREDRRFMKTLNLVSNMQSHGEKDLMEVAYMHSNSRMFELDRYVGKNKAISDYSSLCFSFDNRFFNRLVEYQNQRVLLKKNSKQGFTLSVLDKVEESLNSEPPLFYENLVAYEKQYGWKNLLRLRKECFWLQSDFTKNEESTINSKDVDNYSFFGNNFEDGEQELHEQEFQEQESVQKEQEVEEQRQQDKHVQNGNEKLEQSFDGNLSEHEQPSQIAEPPKCSTRVSPIQVAQQSSRAQSKILCGTHLQKLFKVVFNDIRLQINLQSWQQKLRQSDVNSFSAIKKELTAMIFLKKGFLHRKLLRNKKCEQAFKMARKLGQSNGVGLVATYQLVLLYVDNHNVKGVQFYLVELMRVLKGLGVESIDTVPEWAKPVLQFVVRNEGLSIIKNIHILFRNVFSSYLRSNFSEERVQEIVQLHKDKA